MKNGDGKWRPYIEADPSVQSWLDIPKERRRPDWHEELVFRCERRLKALAEALTPRKEL